MSVTAFDDVQDHNRKLIRKALQGSVFVKRWDDADTPITKIWTTASGLVIPAGFVDVGMITKSDAVKFARDTDSADVESWGYGEPTRRDLTKDITTMEFTMQESKRQAFELHSGVDLSQVRADADKNIVIDKPRRPQAIDYRVFSLSKDGDGVDAIYFMKLLPNASVTGVSEQTHGEDAELTYGVTMTGFFDEDYGTAVREIWGGPGIDVTGMGFQTAP